MNTIKPNINFEISKLPIKSSIESLDRFITQVRTFLRKFRDGFETHFDNYLTAVENRTLPLAPHTIFRKADSIYTKLVASLKKFESALRDDFYTTASVARELESVHNKWVKLIGQKTDKNTGQLLSKFNNISKVFKQLAEDYRNNISNFFQLQASLDEMIIIYTSLSGKTFKIFMRNQYEEFLELLGLEEADRFAIKVSKAAESVKKFNDKLVEEFKKDLDLLNESKLREVFEVNLLNLDKPRTESRPGTQNSRPNLSTFEPIHQTESSFPLQSTDHLFGEPDAEMSNIEENPDMEVEEQRPGKRRRSLNDIGGTPVIKQQKVTFKLNTDSLISSITPKLLKDSGIIEQNTDMKDVRTLLNDAKVSLNKWNNLWLRKFTNLPYYKDFIKIFSDFMLENSLDNSNVQSELKNVDNNLENIYGQLFNDGEEHSVMEIIEINSSEKSDAKFKFLHDWLIWIQMIHLFMCFEINKTITNSYPRAVNNSAKSYELIDKLTKLNIVRYLHEQKVTEVEKIAGVTYSGLEELRQAMMDVYKHGIIQMIKVCKLELIRKIKPNKVSESVINYEWVKLRSISKLFDDLIMEPKNIFNLPN